MLGSLLLHALLFGVSVTRHREAAPPVSKIVAASADIQLEVEIESAVVTPETASAEARELEPARAGTAPRRVTPMAMHVEAGAGKADEVAAADQAIEEAGQAEEPSPAIASSSSSASSPRLSLAQLGVEGANPFLDRDDPAAVRAAKAARVKRRLDRALAQGLTDADLAQGRGAGGPVLRSLEAAVYASSVPLNGNASFTFVIDSDGKLISSALGASSDNRDAWTRVAHQAAQALASRKLSVPKGKGVRLTVAVSSHLELPSGADPGVEMSVQGLPLKKGGGPRSTRLDLSIFPFPAATLAGDPADLGARARRMVHSHVVSEEIL